MRDYREVWMTTTDHDDDHHHPPVSLTMLPSIVLRDSSPRERFIYAFYPLLSWFFLTLDSPPQARRSPHSTTMNSFERRATDRDHASWCSEQRC